MDDKADLSGLKTSELIDALDHAKENTRDEVLDELESREIMKYLSEQIDDNTSKIEDLKPLKTHVHKDGKVLVEY